MKKKTKLVLILSLILYLIAFTCSEVSRRREIRKREIEEIGKKEFSETVKEIRENFNVIIDENKYVVKQAESQPGLMFPGLFYKIAEKNPVKNKSKYFSNEAITEYTAEDLEVEISRGEEYSIHILNNENYIPFFDDKKSRIFLEIAGKYNFRNYILNNFLYDKSKGNDFSKIEEILEKYGDKKIKWYLEAYWRCDSGKELISSIFFVPDEKCVIHNYKEGTQQYSYNTVLEYGIKLKKYFSQPRKLEEIDWYEFMKYNNIHPVIYLNIENISQEEAEKIVKEIRKYYNSEDIIIIINGKS